MVEIFDLMWVNCLISENTQCRWLTPDRYLSSCRQQRKTKRIMNTPFMRFYESVHACSEYTQSYRFGSGAAVAAVRAGSPGLGGALTFAHFVAAQNANRITNRATAESKYWKCDSKLKPK